MTAALAIYLVPLRLRTVSCTSRDRRPETLKKEGQRWYWFDTYTSHVYKF